MARYYRITLGKEVKKIENRRERIVWMATESIQYSLVDACHFNALRIEFAHLAKMTVGEFVIGWMVTGFCFAERKKRLHMCSWLVHMEFVWGSHKV